MHSQQMHSRDGFCLDSLSGPSRFWPTPRAGAMASAAPHVGGLAILALSVREMDVLRPALLHTCIELLPGLTPPEAARQAMLQRAPQITLMGHC